MSVSPYVPQLNRAKGQPSGGVAFAQTKFSSGDEIVAA